MATVLIIGFPKKEENRIEAFYKSVGVDCSKAPSIDSALERIPSDPPTLVVTEKPDSLESLYSLQAVLHRSAPSTPFLVSMREKSISDAMELMKGGAYDCLIQPHQRFDLLVASKRATKAQGRTLFVQKLAIPKRRWDLGVLLFLVGALVVSGIRTRFQGPPEPVLNLGSATLSGIQWDDRDLWVGNWVDSTITHYKLKKGFFRKERLLDTKEIFKMQDSQPIMVCKTEDMLVTIGFDLKLRTHQLGVGLPTLQTTSAPGTSPSGLAWDGQYLWSSDSQTGLLYKHGADLKVLESIPSIIPNPTGLAWDGSSLWILGGSPFMLARLERYGFGNVWRGPYFLANALTENITPSGMAVGFQRLWLVSGGDPRMISRSLSDILSEKNQKWKVKVSPGVVKNAN